MDTGSIQSGAVGVTDFVKRWNVVDDDRLEQTCEALAGARVPIDQPFPGGLMTPPAHANCRCSLSIEPAE